MSDRKPCMCHGSWPLHADDQARHLELRGREIDRLKRELEEARTFGEEIYEWTQRVGNPAVVAIGDIKAVVESVEGKTTDRDAMVAVFNSVYDIVRNARTNEVEGRR